MWYNCRLLYIHLVCHLLWIPFYSFAHRLPFSASCAPVRSLHTIVLSPRLGGGNLWCTNKYPQPPHNPTFTHLLPCWQHHPYRSVIWVVSDRPHAYCCHAQWLKCNAAAGNNRPSYCLRSFARVKSRWRPKNAIFNFPHIGSLRRLSQMGPARLQ